MVELATAWQRELPDNVVSLGSMRGGRLAVLCASGDLFYLDETSGNVLREIQAHKNDGFSLAVHPGGASVATGGGDGFMRVFSEEGAVLMEGKPGGAWVEKVAFSSDGSFLAGAAGKNVLILNKEGNEAARHLFEKSTIADIAWRPEKYELFVAGYGGVTVVKPKPGEVLGKYPRQGSILKISVSKNGKFLAAGCQDNAMHFWTLATGKDLFMSGYGTKVTQVAFAKDDTYLVSVGGDNSVIWNLGGKGPAGSKPIMTPVGENLITAMTVSSSGNLMATGDMGGELGVFSLVKPRQDLAPQSLLNCGREVLALDFSPDEKRLFVATDDGLLVCLGL